MRIAHSSHDFGRDVLPRIIRTHEVYGYEFGGTTGRVSADGYWRDVGTIDAYYQANMDLLKSNPPLDLYQHDWPIHTTEIQSPPARSMPGRMGQCCEIENTILASGTIVRGGSVWSSVLSHDVLIDEGASVKHCVLFDDVRVGADAKLKNCIVDKRVEIPPGEYIGYDRRLDERRFEVSDGGVVVIPNDYQFHQDSRMLRPMRTDETVVLESEATMHARSLSKRQTTSS